MAVMTTDSIKARNEHYRSMADGTDSPQTDRQLTMPKLIIYASLYMDHWFTENELKRSNFGAVSLSTKTSKRGVITLFQLFVSRVLTRKWNYSV